MMQRQGQGQRKKQIPFGDDRQKGEGEGKGRSRFPLGMRSWKTGRWVGVGLEEFFGGVVGFVDYAPDADEDQKESGYEF